MIVITMAITPSLKASRRFFPMDALIRALLRVQEDFHQITPATAAGTPKISRKMGNSAITP